MRRVQPRLAAGDRRGGRRPPPAGAGLGAARGRRRPAPAEAFPAESFAAALEFRPGRRARGFGAAPPALLTEWGLTTVTWWTHKIKGLHVNDFIMAAKTDELAAERLTSRRAAAAPPAARRRSRRKRQHQHGLDAVHEGPVKAPGPFSRMSSVETPRAPTSRRWRARTARRGGRAAHLAAERAEQALDDERVEDADADGERRAAREHREQHAERAPRRQHEPAAGDAAQQQRHADGTSRSRPPCRPMAELAAKPAA